VKGRIVGAARLLATTNGIRAVTPVFDGLWRNSDHALLSRIRPVVLDGAIVSALYGFRVIGSGCRPARHCERSEAIQGNTHGFMDCFVALRAPRNDGRLQARASQTDPVLPLERASESKRLRRTTHL
jgi:hypothetical protein